MSILNTTLMIFGVIFALFDSTTMMIDMSKNMKGLLKFMRGTIIESRKKLERRGEKRIYYFLVLMLTVTQTVLMINMCLVAKQNNMQAIGMILIIVLVLFIYTSIRNVVLLRIPDETAQKVMKFIAVDTLIIVIVNLGQLLNVGLFVYCMVKGLPFSVLFA